jgi:hypothetical protein
MSKEQIKDLAYWKANAEEDYLHVPISVLRYISELEKQQGYNEEEVENVLIEYVKTNPSKPYNVISWFMRFKRNNLTPRNPEVEGDMS